MTATKCDDDCDVSHGGEAGIGGISGIAIMAILAAHAAIGATVGVGSMGTSSCTAVVVSEIVLIIITKNTLIAAIVTITANVNVAALAFVVYGAAFAVIVSVAIYDSIIGTRTIAANRIMTARISIDAMFTIAANDIAMSKIIVAFTVTIAAVSVMCVVPSWPYTKPVINAGIFSTTIGFEQESLQKVASKHATCKQHLLRFLCLALVLNSDFLFNLPSPSGAYLSRPATFITRPACVEMCSRILTQISSSLTLLIDLNLLVRFVYCHDSVVSIAMIAWCGVSELSTFDVAAGTCSLMFIQICSRVVTLVCIVGGKTKASVRAKKVAPQQTQTQQTQQRSDAQPQPQPQPHPQ
eukprot:6202329-Pleurochrysis_carterae.AAC.4